MPRMRMFGMLQNNPALTLKELIKLVKKHDQVTVYRNIELFEKLGIINRLRLGWHTKIELSDIFQHHHHHIACINCGKVWALKEDKLIEQQIKILAQSKQFKTIDHQLEIRGLCAKCQK
jgi:Fur family ferric uptake transcriptional regulator